MLSDRIGSIITDIPIIDSHIHIGTWSNSLYRNFDTSLDAYLKKYGVHSAICMKADMFSDRSSNKSVQESVVNQNKKVRGTLGMAVWLRPVGDYSISLSELISNQCAKAIKVHASIDWIPLGILNPYYNRMIEVAYLREVPIIVHCGATSITADHNLVAQAAKDNQGVTFIAAHLGGKDDSSKIKAIDTFKNIPNICVDISSTKYHNVITYAIKNLGTDRILFGSDWPIMSPYSQLAVLLDAVDNERDLIKICYDTPKSVFNL